MAVLKQLEPKSVFHYFEEICNIPHGSGNVRQISDYLKQFAQDRGLEYVQDDALNMIIVKEAAAGYEAEEPIILQGHMDMVAVKKPDCSIDMKTEGLRLGVEGDKVYAEGTSLGGDDGIAVAYALALLDAGDIPHPRLEVIITTEEETGMDGAWAIDLSMLKGHMMINLDSEEEGIFLTSCAGGASVDCRIPASYEKMAGCIYEVAVKGLQGGHSGAEIHKERGNSNVLMGRLLYWLLGKAEYSVCGLEGGLASNAIPRETKAVMVVRQGQTEAFENVVKEYEAVLQKELKVKDRNVVITCEQAGSGEKEVLTQDVLKRAAAMIYTQPNGVQAMSADIHGLVQTSLNLGILRMDREQIFAEYAVRSSVASECDMLVERLALSTELFGGRADRLASYPAWEYKQDSRLRERMVDVYRRMYGTEPKVEAIHAGLECGILSSKIEGLDCVSIGPDMKDIHTTEETLSISSVKRVWEFLLEVLKTK